MTLENGTTVHTQQGETVTVIEQSGNMVYVYNGRNGVWYHISKLIVNR